MPVKEDQEQPSVIGFKMWCHPVKGIAVEPEKIGA